MITDTSFTRQSREVMTQFELSAERTVLRKFVNREKWIRQGMVQAVQKGNLKFHNFQILKAMQPQT